MCKEEFYKYGETLNISINDLQRLKMLADKCQQDNDWAKGCECKESIGQTWCCNQCGLPYDTRKSDKKYTDNDVFLIAQKLWNDLTNNDTLTYNTFEEYFNDKLKK